MKVLIPHDVRSAEAIAVEAAIARPWPPETLFCLLNVNVPLTPPLMLPRVFEDSKATILGKLERHVELLERSGLKVCTEVREGSPRRVINAFADEWNADLVMIGTHEHSQLTRRYLGSVAQSVMRHAPCSVEIVRAFRNRGGKDAGMPMNILVATDGSDCATAALRFVAHHPWPSGSRIKAISVPELVLVKDALYFEKHKDKHFTDLGKAAVDEAEANVSAARRILSESPFSVIGEMPTYEDRTYEVILHEAETWGANLIVVGSHGRTGFDRMIMGSVSESVGLHAKCSVQVVRER